MVSFAVVMSKLTSPPTADPVSEHQYGKPTQQVTGAGSNEKSNDGLELFLDGGRFEERGDIELSSFPKGGNGDMANDAATGKRKLFRSGKQR